jgi:hypothetical protein
MGPRIRGLTARLFLMRMAALNQAMAMELKARGAL